ncbi:MAG: hypothetical protein ACOX6S_04690, partial [Clostridia bacterium]
MTWAVRRPFFMGYHGNGGIDGWRKHQVSSAQPAELAKNRPGDMMHPGNHVGTVHHNWYINSRIFA